MLMKKRYILILFLISILLLTSCKKEMYVIELEMDKIIQDSLKINPIYQVKKDKKYSFPSFDEFDYVTYQYHLDDEKYIILKKENTISFIGWVDSNTNELLNQEIEVSANINAVLKYETIVKNKQTIILNLNNGDIDPATLNPTFKQNYEVLKPIRKDYTFLGWCSDESLTSEFITSLDFTKENNYHLYAKYEANIDSVERLINNLPLVEEIKEENIEQIEYAYSLYIDLNNEDKTLLSNPNILLNAYQRCLAIKKINEIIRLIDELPTVDKVISTDKFKTDEILRLYNELTYDEQNEVTNFDKFMQVHEQAEYWYAMWSSIAMHYDERVLKLPLYPSSDYARDIETFYRLYTQSIDEDQLTPLLKLGDRVELIYENLKKLENSKIEYVFNTTVSYAKTVQSKQQLFNSFFTDFYHYIILYHGTSKLEANNINSLEDFLNLASNLNEIGNVVSEYLLQSDINGKLSNQPKTTFIGFCYKNNLYIDVINHLIKFFEYWQIGEGNENINFFSDSVVTTTNIAQFFYYDQETSPIKTEEVIDYLNNIAGVVYGLENNLFTNDLSLRGYSFKGWYLTNDFSGEQVTSLPETNDEKIILYAKWEINTN